jgi:small subunit ribosomal protein S24e
MIVDILHPGRANVSKKELSEVIGGMYKADPKLTILFGFRTKFGGGKSTGFCLIYDNEEAARKFEPKYRLIRQGFAEKKEQSRKAIKEAKNKGKKIRGTGASIAKHKAKRAAEGE